MTLADDIIRGRMPDFDYYLEKGESLDDIDEYGFTPLIECAITGRIKIMQKLIELKVDVNKPDVTGCTALHWAVDHSDLDMTLLLLKNGANANAYTTAGLSVLVYPVLRGQHQLKHLLYQYGAVLDFAQDFIYAKLLGHRFELKGDVDLVTAHNEFIELDYEGFILEFTVAVVHDSLCRFTSNYSTREYRDHFPLLYLVMDGFKVAEELLQLQHYIVFNEEHRNKLAELIQSPMLILPAASRGHAICFVRFGQWWAKIDRGENSLQEGSVNIYRITNLQAFNLEFVEDFLYKKHDREYFHSDVNVILGLVPTYKIPIASQVVGNCSWANVQAVIPVGYILQSLVESSEINFEPALHLYNAWVEWDKDRALDECIQRFYNASAIRKASFASMLAAVLYHSCDERNHLHRERAEKIVSILTLPDYYYILQTYLNEYCVRNFTFKGNNLLKLLDDCGFNPDLGVNPIATGLDGRGS